MLRLVTTVWQILQTKNERRHLTKRVLHPYRVRFQGSHNGVAITKVFKKNFVEVHKTLEEERKQVHCHVGTSSRNAQGFNEYRLVGQELRARTMLSASGLIKI